MYNDEPDISAAASYIPVKDTEGPSSVAEQGFGVPSSSRSRDLRYWGWERSEDWETHCPSEYKLMYLDGSTDWFSIRQLHMLFIC